MTRDKKRKIRRDNRVVRLRMDITEKDYVNKLVDVPPKNTIKSLIESAKR